MTYLIPLCNEYKNLLRRDFDAEGYIYPYFILCSVATLNEWYLLFKRRDPGYPEAPSALLKCN
jgi:hypothetical protein